MYAIIYRHYGPPEVMELADIAKPTIRPDEVLVAVKAAGLNQMDLKLAAGQFKLLTGSKFPKQTGADFSGEIVEVGEKVNQFKIGDEVFAYIVSMKGLSGTVAEYFAVKAAAVARKPASIQHEVAAALPCVYQTALQGLRNQGNLKAGGHVLIYGASGGVGSAAIQLAKHMKAHVTTVSSSKNKEYCLKQGADSAFAYDEGNVWDRLPTDFDIIFQVYETKDSLFKTASKHLKVGGIFLVSPTVKHILANLFAILRGTYKVVTVNGNAEDLTLLGQLASQKLIQPDIKVFGLHDYKKAFQLMAGFKGKGKTVIRVNE
ncbi:NAD(P)-dependent alcohol dehydrogenase (plasmid) [Spirosoma sp. SC4-14]|uniref:NAD(P)-dependent alcohol dehydrogenase n=1 Tax=Spirosoma sp. SC4-14 TaxID=3128900 RepID=UPI0030D3257A